MPGTWVWLQDFQVEQVFETRLKRAAGGADGCGVMSYVRPLPIVVILLLGLLVLPASASAARTPPGMPPAGKVLLGVGGHALEPQQFDRQTGGLHDIHLITVAWNEQRTWTEALGNRLDHASRHGYRIMLHIGTKHVNTGREVRSPGAVSRGLADRYFLDMGRVINESGQLIYLRPPAEMNGHWSEWSAFNANGSRRNADHSTRSYRRAFIRIALIGRGGSVAAINRSLRNNGMPALRTSLTTLPRSGRIATVWNPQGRGKPDVRGNQPKDYYPGRYVVDYVANDVYAQRGRAAWADNQALYDRYKRLHPFMMAEYAPWGYDDPAFMRQMFRWVATNPRTVAMIYFNGTSATTFRLSSKPRSLAAYRKMAKQARFRCPALTAFVSTCS